VKGGAAVDGHRQFRVGVPGELHRLLQGRAASVEQRDERMPQRVEVGVQRAVRSLDGVGDPGGVEVEAVPDGPSVGRLIEMARRHRLVLCAGLSEKERDIVYNTAVLVGPDGYIGKQRKLHLSRDEGFFYKGGRELPVFDAGPGKVGVVICYDNQFPEVARVLALRGAEVLLMPHAARFKVWDDTPQGEAAARRHSHDFFKLYALRARENACFAVLADQAGRAGHVAQWPRDSENQPHHAGAALVWGPDGELIASTQEERIREEMILATLDAALLGRERALANYMLRTRRPELFGELLREQVSC
jgi:predicted amidohydrolase